MCSMPCLKNRIYRVSTTVNIANRIRYGPVGVYRLLAFFSREKQLRRYFLSSSYCILETQIFPQQSDSGREKLMMYMYTVSSAPCGWDVPLMPPTPMLDSLMCNHKRLTSANYYTVLGVSLL